jgi:hypothetical protein
MEQETNLRLSGKIGDKIAVNLKYNSKQDEQLFDPTTSASNTPAPKMR